MVFDPFRRRRVAIGGVDAWVLAPEDQLLLELASDAEDAPWHWRSALAILAKHEIDWSVLGRPANEESGLRVLGPLLYARTEGISVPDAPINRNDPGESSDQVKPSQLSL